MERISTRVQQEKLAKQSKDETEVRTELASTPENWTARHEQAPSREYIGFEIQAARVLADKLDIPVVEAAKAYTTLLHSHLWTGTEGYIVTENLSDEQLADALYKSERMSYENKPPTEYHEDTRYGCFTYHHQLEVPVVDIHFKNVESDEIGPLATEKAEQRLHELHDLFAEIKREYPDTAEVEGNSWLYNVESYRQLFPESYTEDAKENRDPAIISRGSMWGQFIDNKGGLKKELADTFLGNLAALEEITPEGIRQAFPLKSLKVRGLIADFYKKYGVE